MAGILEMVAEAVRNRQQFARKIRSLTAMGRAVGLRPRRRRRSSWLGTITLLSREYMDPLYHTAHGQQAC